MSIEMSELIAFRDKFERTTREFDAFLRKFLIRQALDVLRKTKQNTPTDTGLLKNSWTIGNQVIALKSETLDDGSVRYFQTRTSETHGATLDSVVRNGDELIITISNVVEYAGYVEYGHSQKIGRFVPKIGKRLVKPWVDGKFMCTLSMLDVKRKIPKRFENEFMRWFINQMKGS